MSGFDRTPPHPAQIIDLDAARRARALPEARRERLLPPPGKRVGDPVIEPETMRRGTVIGWAPRAAFDGGHEITLAVQFPGFVRVLPAARVIPVSQPAAQAAQ